MVIQDTLSMVTGRLQRAFNKLNEAKDYLNRALYPESISAAQECIELSIKSAFLLLGVTYLKKADRHTTPELAAQGTTDWSKVFSPPWFEPQGQLAYLDLAVAVDNIGVLFQSADPDDTTTIEELGEPPGVIPAVKGEIGKGEPQSQHFHDHPLGQLDLGSIA
jgi:hypothetical protein